MLSIFNYYSSDKTIGAKNYNRKNIDQIFKEYKPDIVINLAAQAGVRYSIDNPMSYVESNLVGFLNILEGCRNYNVEHLI